jgi:hypothetical protein
MLNDTIPDQGWQLESPIYGRCVITTHAYAQMVLYSLHACAEVRGIGVHAMPLTHPDAWQALTIPRIDACTVPVAMDACDIRPDVVQRIQTHSSQHMTRWVGIPVTVSVAVVNATLLQRKG